MGGERGGRLGPSSIRDAVRALIKIFTLRLCIRLLKAC